MDRLARDASQHPRAGRNRDDDQGGLCGDAVRHTKLLGARIAAPGIRVGVDDRRGARLHAPSALADRQPRPSHCAHRHRLQSARRWTARCAQSPGRAMTAILAVHAYTLDYATHSGPVRALDAVSLDIAPGTVLGLVGES